MRIFSRLAVSVLLLSLSLPVQASGLHQKEHDASTGTTIVGRAADMSVITNHGCEDDVVGVTIKDGVVDLGSPAVATVDVFGSFIFNCEGGGGSSSFAGSVPLLPGDLTQTGTDSATFEKTFNVQGHDLHLTLAWTGTGAVTTDATTGKSTRAATVTGEFSVDGLNQIEGSSIILGNLTITQTASTDHSCKDGKHHEKKHPKKEKPRHSS